MLEPEPEPYVKMEQEWEHEWEWRGKQEYVEPGEAEGPEWWEQYERPATQEEGLQAGPMQEERMQAEGTGYIVDVYLYTGRRGVLRRHGCGAGNLNARQLMAMWSKRCRLTRSL